MKTKKTNFTHLFDKENFAKLLVEMYEEIEECDDIAYKAGYKQAILNINTSYMQFCKRKG